jgi:hypothetical protein
MNKVEKAAYNKAYKAANKDRLAVTTKAYKAANKDEIAAYQKAYKEANREEIAVKNKAYREANREEMAVKGKAYREANREEMAVKGKAYREANPLKYAAHRMVKNALKSGKLIKPKPCTNCNKEAKLDGHHHDYSKPLEVTWLCRSCHKREHARINRNEKANK